MKILSWRINFQRRLTISRLRLDFRVEFKLGSEFETLSSSSLPATDCPRSCLLSEIPNTSNKTQNRSKIFFESFVRIRDLYFLRLRYIAGVERRERFAEWLVAGWLEIKNGRPPYGGRRRRGFFCRRKISRESVFRFRCASSKNFFVACGSTMLGEKFCKNLFSCGKFPTVNFLVKK